MKNLVNKGDYNRVLLSETAPLDVPNIFSNNWFYKHIYEWSINKENQCIKNKIIEDLFVCSDSSKDFVPIKYSILKSNGGLRHLGLLHPASQTQAIELYRIFSDRIISSCSKSSYSMRKPHRVSSFYYSKKDKLDNNYVFQPSTFFSYAAYNKLSRFFDSKEFLMLERKYTHFWSVDISKFFDSIYTHSISWALKNKSFAKESREKSDFSSFFDRLMQRANYNETNGIIIGNEVSRIFAELLMQAVDSELEKELDEIGLFNGKQYCIKRYVDDYFIFGSSDADLTVIKSKLESKLRFYKLSLNENKFIKRERPFITSITRAKIDTQESISWLFSFVFCYEDNNNLRLIIRPNLVKRKFIDRVMTASYEDFDAYTVMCGYSIAAILNKIKLVFKDRRFMNSDFGSQKNAIFVLLDIAFHLFNISPTSSNSLKLSTLCYSVYKYFQKMHPEDMDLFILEVSNQVDSFFSSSSFNKMSSSVNTFVPIEFSNLLCISRVMGNEYLLPAATFSKVFNIDGLKRTSQDYLSNEDSFDYFHIMSALYYAGGVDDYKSFVETLTKEINKRLLNLSRIKYDARVCYLFLDSMSCPYIDIKKKKAWAKKYEKVCFGKELSDEKSQELLEVLVNNTWFICWDTDLVFESLLDNKELIFGY